MLCRHEVMAFLDFQPHLCSLPFSHRSRKLTCQPHTYRSCVYLPATKRPRQSRRATLLRTQLLLKRRFISHTTRYFDRCSIPHAQKDSPGLCCKSARAFRLAFYFVSLAPTLALTSAATCITSTYLSCTEHTDAYTHTYYSLCFGRYVRCFNPNAVRETPCTSSPRRRGGSGKVPPAVRGTTSHADRGREVGKEG